MMIGKNKNAYKIRAGLGSSRFRSDVKPITEKAFGSKWAKHPAGRGERKEGARRKKKKALALRAHRRVHHFFAGDSNVGVRPNIASRLLSPFSRVQVDKTDRLELTRIPTYVEEGVIRVDHPVPSVRIHKGGDQRCRIRNVERDPF